MRQLVPNIELRLSIEFNYGHLTLLCHDCFGICAFEMKQVVLDEECGHFGENAGDKCGSIAVSTAQKTYYQLNQLSCSTTH